MPTAYKAITVSGEADLVRLNSLFAQGWTYRDAQGAQSAWLVILEKQVSQADLAAEREATAKRAEAFDIAEAERLFTRLPPQPGKRKPAPRK